MSYPLGLATPRLRYSESQTTRCEPVPPVYAHRRRASSDWPPSATEQEHAYLDYAWHMPPHGTRILHSVPTAAPGSTAEQAYPGAVSTAQAAGMPSAWLAEGEDLYGPHAEAIQCPPETWMNAAGPWTTVAPAATIWHPLATPIYDPSASLGIYTAELDPSARSSPYTHSEGYAGAFDSPRIKIEQSLRSVTPIDHTLPEPSFLGHPIVLRTKNGPFQPLAMHQGQPEHVHQRSAFAYEDSKLVSTPRRPPPTRKAFSCEDIRAGTRLDGHKRGYTKPEEAECSCERCGKLFQRSYNLRAHMETHDPRRAQPHSCQYPACNKRFVRRTDLLRHEQSVHLKSREHMCPLCSTSFARKDTLRRHVDDGCPLRPEMKRRNTRSRRVSCAPSERRRLSQQSQDQNDAAAQSRRS
ncbi:hypothetical protein LTR53_017494 [Teratosphaeriaceae sp. CCFEE 6253]|nr:hypothetical protein LTR53_017494 [Teratosphaeriaceae sp. CCFEE 6253]